MKKNVLYILSSYNRFTGTPKKIYDLIRYAKINSFLYVWSVVFANEFKKDFEENSLSVFEGNYGRNLFKHQVKLLEIIDNNNIQIIQTQFFFGELLAGIVKFYRPTIKVVVTFEGALPSNFFKRIIQKFIYKKVSQFVYISKFVKEEKEKEFPQLENAISKVIYNGTAKLVTNEDFIKKEKNQFSLLSVSSLIKIKNIDILLNAMQFLLKEKHNDIHLYIAGDGQQKEELEQKVKRFHLASNVHFLGKQKMIGNLLEFSDALVHPCYIEGFGLSVVEAMMAEKPVIVSNSGALPELIKDKQTGILAHPFKVEDWVNAILKLKQEKEFARQIAKNGRNKAEKHFSILNFVEQHKLIYNTL